MMAPFQPAPPPSSPFHRGGEPRVRALLSEWFDLKLEQHASTFRIASGEAYWQLYSTSYGPTKTLADSLGERREQLRRAWVGARDGGRAMRRRWLATPACLLVALTACGGSSDERGPRDPLPAPSVELSGADRQLWAPTPPSRAAVPVLLYRGVAPADFARQMALLDHAGYETIELDDLVRFVKGEQVALPPRPLLLTFDGGRLDSWQESDATLRELDFNAVVFVNVGCVEEENGQCLTWDELGRLQAGGRWDVQLQSGTGGRLIQYGPAPDDVGPFYAYRGTDEVLGGWRERVFSDVTYGEDQLSRAVQGYRPLAFAPAYGNYGQAGTNDPRIPRLLLRRLELSFELVFTQDRSGFARPNARNPLGRFQITPDITDEDLHALLASAPVTR